MQDISCPHCGKAFKIDETSYADILKQVRDHEFEEQIQARLELAEREKRDAEAEDDSAGALRADDAAAPRLLGNGEERHVLVGVRHCAAENEYARRLMRSTRAFESNSEESTTFSYTVVFAARVCKIKSGFFRRSD